MRTPCWGGSVVEARTVASEDGTGWILLPARNGVINPTDPFLEGRGSLRSDADPLGVGEEVSVPTSAAGSHIDDFVCVTMSPLATSGD